MISSAECWEKKTLQVKNTKILDWLQFLLAQVSKLGISGSKNISSPLYQVFIYKTTVLLQLCQFWDIIQSELAYKSSYTANIRDIRMKLLEL